MNTPYEKAVKEKYPNAIVEFSYKYDSYIAVIHEIKYYGPGGKTPDRAWKAAYRELFPDGKFNLD